jgi:hypothetical protein
VEQNIIMLDERTDQATRQMLQKVIERKRKYEHLKFRHIIVMWATVFAAFLYLYYLYQTVLDPYSYSFAAMFSVYVDNSANLYYLVFTVGLYGFMNLLQKKRDKAENEYNALRCEIIDKSKDLWKQEDQWKNRHLVFEMMKSNYDINLYHENK